MTMTPQMPMPIPSTSRLVADLWMDAETDTRSLLATDFPDQDEEFITKFFHGHFRRTVRNADEGGLIKAAFLDDLQSEFPCDIETGYLDRLAADITATVELHSKQDEGKSGGDFGLIFSRPSITAHDSGITVDEDRHLRGLLCQAKIEQRGSKPAKCEWGRFTGPQQGTLENRLEYLALVLYRRAGPKRHSLEPFRWQRCDHAKTLQEAKRWLRTDDFPGLISSDEIITLLGKDRIGTDDKQIINRYISPGSRESLVVKIDWPPGAEPPPQWEFELESHRQSENERLQVLLCEE